MESDIGVIICLNLVIHNHNILLPKSWIYPVISKQKSLHPYFEMIDFSLMLFSLLFISIYIQSKALQFVVWLLTHLSWAFRIACCPLFVCPLSVRQFVHLSVNFSHFDFFSRTSRPVSTKLGANDSWVEGIQVCSNDGPRLSPRWDSTKE